jgi:hypothetical protein
MAEHCGGVRGHAHSETTHAVEAAAGATDGTAATVSPDGYSL